MSAKFPRGGGSKPILSHPSILYYRIYQTRCKKEIKYPAALAFYLFSATCFINSINKHKHSCKILYLVFSPPCSRSCCLFYGGVILLLFIHCLLWLPLCVEVLCWSWLCGVVHSFIAWHTLLCESVSPSVHY